MKKILIVLGISTVVLFGVGFLMVDWSTTDGVAQTELQTNEHGFLLPDKPAPAIDKERNNEIRWDQARLDYNARLAREYGLAFIEVNKAAGNKLEEWDVVRYLFSLGFNTPEIQQGMTGVNL